MSRSHIRIHKEEPPVKPQFAFWVGLFCVLIAVGAYYSWSNTRASGFWETHSFSVGTVSETRVVVDRLSESGYGGRIFYRLEAHVRYTAEGQQRDRWLVVKEDTSDRALLLAKQASSPKTCQVYWPPGNVENAKCMFN